MATTHRYRAERVAGIDPVDGWSLYDFIDNSDFEQLPTREYVARNADCDVLLNVCERKFSPTTERFAWLVRNGFPAGAAHHGALFPFSNEDIDAACAQSMGIAA
jgi:hypothetical protein